MEIPFARVRALAGACAAVLLTLAPALAAPPPAGPAGEAFYVPPFPLPPGERGSVIRARPLEGTMALPGAARNVLVLYRSIDAEGRIVPVSGTVAIPPGEPPAGGWPVIAWTHGTTGLAAACAPSKDTADGPEHPYIAAIATLLDGFVRQGHAVVATDYQGLGVAGFHPFLQGVPNGRNALDMVRAAREVEPRLGTRYAVMGHSQGGQADLFTAALGPEDLRGFTLVGNIAFAPGSHIAGRLQAVMASPKVELALPYVLYVLHSYAANHAEIAPGRILTAQALSHLPDLQEGCMTRALTTGYWATAIARDQFLPDAETGPFLAVAARNEPGTLSIAVPTLLMQGTADATVRPQDTDDVARQLCARSNLVEYRIFPDADHDAVMTAGAEYAREWMVARFAGRQAAGNCAALPRAAPTP